MTLTCDAVFENGVFRPVATLPEPLAESQQVRLVVKSKAADVLALAADVYRGLTEEEIAEVERIALDRDHFSERPPVLTAPALPDTDTLSLITRYEILRGLKAKGADVQAGAFERFCAANTVLALTDAIAVRAAGIYADLYRRGLLIGDADILIAATALEHGLTLVTNNENHFRRVPGLAMTNWRTREIP